MKEDEVKKVKVKMSFYEAMKFGIGFGAGIFIWCLFLVLLSGFLLDRYLQIGGGMLF